MDASRLVAKLRGLSGRERALLLLGAGAVLVFVFIRWGVTPALGEYRRNRGAIPDRESTLAHYALAAQGQDNVAAALADAVDLLQALEEGLLDGENPSAAGVSLQGLLKPMVERPDTRVTSVRGLPPVVKGLYAEVAVQMDMQTTTEGLAGILASIPRSGKFLRVKKLSVSAGYYGAALANRKENLVASVVVSGVARSPGEEKPEGRVREAEE